MAKPPQPPQLVIIAGPNGSGKSTLIAALRASPDVRLPALYINADDLQRKPERLVEVEWASAPGSVFLVAIQVEALDRNRLLSDITRCLSDQHMNILSAALSTTKDRICKAKFTFQTGDPTHLDHVLGAVRQVPSVFDVYRVNQ